MTAPLFGPDPNTLPDATSKTLDDYVGKITPWQAKPAKAKFLATISAGVQTFVDQGAIAAGLPALFDLDFAVGAQLDIVGMWIGQSRSIVSPIPNVFFSLDVAGLGLDEGYFQGPYDSEQGISFLPDDLYRRLLYAKVPANRWDGTVDMAEGILTTFFQDPASLVFIDDGGFAIPDAPYFSLDEPTKGLDVGYWYREPTPHDLGIDNDGSPDFVPYPIPDVPPVAGIEYTIAIAGKISEATDLYILGDGLIPVRATGAKIVYSVTTVDGAALFGLDMETDEISGLDVGAFGADPAAVAKMIYG